ncbi:MAG TPA: hypothetical protein VGC35_06010 [Allosphingosinicella sp.]|jgi:glutamyl-tRNA reductase
MTQASASLEKLVERHLPALLALTRTVSCNFIDARTASKDVVRAVAQRHAGRPAAIPSAGELLVSTCLRFELYRYDGAGQPLAPFFHASGLTCVRRFLSMITGLQSEIVGEQEILLQVSEAVRAGRRRNRLLEPAEQGFAALLALGAAIREHSGVDSHENYSTTAADLIVSHVARGRGATVAIVGGGYMAEAFFSALLRARFANVRHILWINRSVAKLRRSLADVVELMEIPLDLLDLDEGSHALAEADAVFCALAASPGRYADAALRQNAFVVDVSYPPVFAPRPGMTLVNIANTDFSLIVRLPIAKSSIGQADRDIDDVIAFLEAAE